MSSFLKVLAALIIVGVGSTCYAADFVIDGDGLYFSDTVTATNKSSETATCYSAFAGFGVDKNNKYQFGWNFSGHSTKTVDSSTAATYNSSEMGPGFIMYFDKDRSWRISFAYDLVTNATDTFTGASDEKWQGTAMNGDLGYQFRWDSDISIGLRVNYSLASYTQSIVGSTTTSVSNSKTLIYPSVALTIEL